MADRVFEATTLCLAVLEEAGLSAPERIGVARADLSVCEAAAVGSEGSKDASAGSGRPSPRPKASKPVKGATEPSEAIRECAKAALGIITLHPGIAPGECAKLAGTHRNSYEFKRAIRWMRKTGRIRVEGTTNACRYFPAK